MIIAIALKFLKKCKFYIPALMELIFSRIDLNTVADEDGNTGLMAIIIACDLDTLKNLPLSKAKNVNFSIKK